MAEMAVVVQVVVVLAGRKETWVGSEGRSAVYKEVQVVVVGMEEVATVEVERVQVDLEVVAVEVAGMAGAAQVVVGVGELMGARAVLEV